MAIGYSNVGGAIDILPNYLVKGAKIVFENEGIRNLMGETIQAKRLIAIILEDGYYMELTEIISSSEIGWYFEL